MWASSDSRLCECWLPEERPAPNWVRTVSAISAAPPVMNGSLAAWLSSWSKQTPTKSRYISSTTGRIPAMAAPTPSPMTAVSEIGVSRTRSPNRSRRPRVSPKTLPPSPTSIPAMNTRSSAASSASRASWTASIMRNTGASAAGGGGSARTGLARRTNSVTVAASGAASRRASSTIRSSVSVTDDSSAASSSSPTPAARSRASCTSEGITRLPLLDLLRGPVALGIALVVTVPPECRGLDHGGAASRPHGADHALHGGRRRHDVVAVDRDVGDAVARGPTLERGPVLRRNGRELGVAVVLTEEDDRQLPDGGEVHGFVERALGGRAVAEERHGDAAVGAELGRGRRADRDRHPRRDDPVGTEDPEPRVGDVHRAAATAVRPLVLAHQFGEHPERVETLGQAVSVAPVGRGDDVSGTEGPACAHGCRLLPDREVDETGDLSVAVERGHPLLEAADHQHPAVHLAEIGRRALGRRGRAGAHGL